MKTADRGMDSEIDYLSDLGRAFGGALLFSLPLMMTMEMWALGVSAAPARRLAFVIVALPVLYGLAHYAGFSARRGLVNNSLDTLVALAVGFSASAAFWPCSTSLTTPP
jgi:uncharacterized membrane protein